MLIKELYLENFRNYDKQKIELNENINVFYGKNAQGKTNILEALYFCSLGRSFRTYKENELINFGNENSKIIIKYFKNNRDNEIEIDLNKNERKCIKLNKIKLNRNSELVGNINLILFYIYYNIPNSPNLTSSPIINNHRIGFRFRAHRFLLLFSFLFYTY